MGKPASNATIKFHVKAEKKRRFRITEFQIYNSTAEEMITQATGFKAKKLDKVIKHKVRAAELKPYRSIGREVCEKEGNPDKVFKKKLLSGIKYSFFVAAHTPKKEYYRSKIVYKKVPLQIICLPEPLKVKNIAMTVKYKKLPGKCKVKAHLQAVIKTNKKSKQDVSFWYYRDNGDRQKVTIKTQNTGIAYFNKHYTFKKAESRKYLINVGGDHPYQTKWTPVKVNCAGSHTGGFQTAPKPNTH